jgi:hypothetical protein
MPTGSVRAQPNNTDPRQTAPTPVDFQVSINEETNELVIGKCTQD